MCSSAALRRLDTWDNRMLSFTQPATEGDEMELLGVVTSSRGITKGIEWQVRILSIPPENPEVGHPLSVLDEDIGTVIRPVTD